MCIGVQRAHERFLSFLLFATGGSNSLFRIRYYLGRELFTINSETIITDDPESDKNFVLDKVQEIKNAGYLEIEKVLRASSVMIPSVEYYL